MFISVRPAAESSTIVAAVKSQCAANDRMLNAERQWRLDTWKEGDAIVLVIEPTDCFHKLHQVLRAVLFGAMSRTPDAPPQTGVVS